MKRLHVTWVAGLDRDERTLYAFAAIPAGIWLVAVARLVPWQYVPLTVAFLEICRRAKHAWRELPWLNQWIEWCWQAKVVPAPGIVRRDDGTLAITESPNSTTIDVEIDPNEWRQDLHDGHTMTSVHEFAGGEDANGKSHAGYAARLKTKIGGTCEGVDIIELPGNRARVVIRWRREHGARQVWVDDHEYITVLDRKPNAGWIRAKQFDGYVLAQDRHKHPVDRATEAPTVSAPPEVEPEPLPPPPKQAPKSTPMQAESEITVSGGEEELSTPPDWQNRAPEGTPIGPPIRPANAFNGAGAVIWTELAAGGESTDAVLSVAAGVSVPHVRRLLDDWRGLGYVHRTERGSWTMPGVTVTMRPCEA
jgi:hypothetical protein